MRTVDIGRWVARYFEVLAWVIIVSTIVALCFGHFHLDLNFILLLWAAHNLKRHNPTARKWTIRLLGLIVVLIGAMLVYAVLAGTEGMHIDLGPQRIEDPPLWMVFAILGGMLLLLAPPLALLLIPRARREFGVTNRVASA